MGTIMSVDERMTRVGADDAGPWLVWSSYSGEWARESQVGFSADVLAARLYTDEAEVRALLADEWLRAYTLRAVLQGKVTPANTTENLAEYLLRVLPQT